MNTWKLKAKCGFCWFFFFYFWGKRGQGRLYSTWELKWFLLDRIWMLKQMSLGLFVISWFPFLASQAVWNSHYWFWSRLANLFALTFLFFFQFYHLLTGTQSALCRLGLMLSGRLMKTLIGLWRPQMLYCPNLIFLVRFALTSDMRHWLSNSGRKIVWLLLNMTCI